MLGIKFRVEKIYLGDCQRLGSFLSKNILPSWVEMMCEKTKLKQYTFNAAFQGQNCEREMSELIKLTLFDEC